MNLGRFVIWDDQFRAEVQPGVRRLDPTPKTLEWRVLTEKKGLDRLCRS